MASRHQCGICLDDFDKPKILPCFHTFCQTCLQNHITTTARNGLIKCGICRKKTAVPPNEAEGFATNFYIDTYYCSKHTKKKLKFYCWVCSVAICFDCVCADHADHNPDELKSVDKELRGSLKAYKLEIENKIKHLNNRLEYLDQKFTDLDAFAKTSKDNVRKKVESICSEVRNLGNEMNDKIDVVRDEGSKDVEALKAEINEDKNRLRASVRCSDDVLDYTSTIQVIDILPRIKTLAEDHSPPWFCIPVKYFNFPQTTINMDSLAWLFGELHTMNNPTFITCFNIDRMKKCQYYWSPDYMVQDLPWYVGVIRHTDKSTLGIYLYINNVKDTNIKSCTAKFKLKLINRIHDSKSISKQASSTFTPGGDRLGWVEFITWYDFRHMSGFLDNNNDFIVQATVEISKICVTSCFDLKRADIDTDYSNNKLVMLQDKYWGVEVDHHNETTLGVYLHLKKEKEMNLTSHTVSHTFKLVHGTDDSKSIEKWSTNIFTPRTRYGWEEFIERDTLQNGGNGFINKGHFTIETTVEVTSSTFTDTFRLTGVPLDKTRIGSSHTIQYLPWRIGVRHHADTSTLGLYLHLHPPVDKTVRTCSAKYKLKLVHQSQSVERELVYTFTPSYGGYGWHEFIDWDDFTSRFVDGQKFTVQATLTIIKIDRY